MVKLVVRDKESIQEAGRRSPMWVERSGKNKQMGRRQHYKNPRETTRPARLRAERRARRTRLMAGA